jgi:hypothetical protein
VLHAAAIHSREQRCAKWEVEVVVWWSVVRWPPVVGGVVGSEGSEKCEK